MQPITSLKVRDTHVSTQSLGVLTEFHVTAGFPTIDSST